MENDLIKKKITEVQNFANGDLGTIIQVQGDQIGQTDVSTLKEDITQSVVSELSEGGLSLNLINLKDVVPTYEDLPDSDLEINDAYQVESDGLVYVYTDTGFQTEGNGFKVQADANGVIEIGNTDPVSGDTVKIYVDNNINDAVNIKKTVSLEIGALELTNGNPVVSTIRVRTVNFQNQSGKLVLDSPNLFIRNVLYFDDGVWSERVNLNYVKEYDINYTGSQNQFKVVLSKAPNTIEIVQSDIDNSILNVITDSRYDFGAIETFKPIKQDYDNAKIDINTSSNELGGIDTTTGENSDNNIRIRSTNKISVLEQAYSIENVTDEYVLSRIFRYKDGVYVNRVNYPDLTFTPDSTYNEVRFVWEKLDNTQIITQQEVNDFKFNVYSNANNKITQIAILTSDIPNIENRLSLLESEENPYNGEELGIEGDSLSTLAGYIYGSNPTFYPAGDVQSIDDTWWGMLMNATGMVLGVNNSYSGSTMAGTTSQSFCSRIANIGNPKICFIFGGANDYRQNIPIGDFNFANTTFDRTQFKQALQYIMYNLLITHPNTKFIFILPTNRSDSGEGRVNGFPINWDNEKFLSDYQDAIIEACNIYGFQYIDTRQLWSYYNASTYTIEGLHFLKSGHNLLFRQILSSIY